MFDIAEDQGHRAPTIRQLSVFLPNQVGSLLRVTRALEVLGLRLHALSVSDAADHAVARLVVDRPALAVELLGEQGLPVMETELLGVGLDTENPDALKSMLGRLLMAELNVQYVYPLLARVGGLSVMALRVDDQEQAARVLNEGGFDLVSQDDLV